MAVASRVLTGEPESRRAHAHELVCVLYCGYCPQLPDGAKDARERLRHRGGVGNIARDRCHPRPAVLRLLRLRPPVLARLPVLGGAVATEQGVRGRPGDARRRSAGSGRGCRAVRSAWRPLSPEALTIQALDFQHGRFAGDLAERDRAAVAHSLASGSQRLATELSGYNPITVSSIQLTASYSVLKESSASTGLPIRAVHTWS